MRHFMLAGGAVVVIAACGGNGSGGTAPGGGGGGGPLVHASRVTATTSLAFDPSAVTIPAGDTIYFTFQSVTHNVKFTAATGVPADVADSHDATAKRQFLTAGTYNYHCSIHPQMTGTITVTP